MRLPFANNKVNAYVTDVPGKLNSSAEFRNCIFSGNLSYDGLKAKDFAVGTPASDTAVSMSHCLFTVPPAEGWTCEVYANIITNDARYDVKGEYPYSLKYSSPARGKGEVADWMQDATDIRGEPRLRGESVDLGCYQCWIDPSGLLLLVK